MRKFYLRNIREKLGSNLPFQWKEIRKLIEIFQLKEEDYYLRWIFTKQGIFMHIMDPKTYFYSFGNAGSVMKL